MFPAWVSNESSSPNTGGQSCNCTRRHSNGSVTVKAVFAGIAILTVVCFSASLYALSHSAVGSDKALGKSVARAELLAMNVTQQVAAAHVAADNPWRGAGRRLRNDLLVSVSGCGGQFRRSIKKGTTARLRYVRRRHGQITDASKQSVAVVAGQGQVSSAIDEALVGLCGGEAAQIHSAPYETTTVYIEEVRLGAPSGREKSAVKDELARSVKASAGRRGRSCDATCNALGLRCERAAFAVLNNCPRLRQLFGCARCEVAAAGAAGSDMPALVAPSAPRGHARGVCLAAPHARLSTCAARYAHTLRLCPCV